MWKTWPQGVADRALFSGSQQMVHSGRIAVAIGGDVYGCDGQERVVRLCRVVERWVPAGFRFEIELGDKTSSKCGHSPGLVKSR